MSPIGGFGNFSNFGNFSSDKLNQHFDTIKEKGLEKIDTVTQNDEFKSSVGESISQDDVSSFKTLFSEMMDSMKNFFGKLFSFVSSFDFSSLKTDNQQQVESEEDYSFNVPPKKEPPTPEEISKQQVYDTKMTRANSGELRAERANIENDERVSSYPTKEEMQERANEVAQRVIKNTKANEN